MRRIDDSQPLITRRERRRRELFPDRKKMDNQQKLLSQSPFPNSPLTRKPTLQSSMVTPQKGIKLSESRIGAPLGKRKLGLHVQESPGPSGNTTPIADEDAAATGPKDYLCRDCRRRFCRRGDRDNHEQLCGHTKWRTGKTFALGLIQLD